MISKKKTIYHLCNRSSKVIFRNQDDYLLAICRLASCAHASYTDVWAYSFMSTHFHLIVKSVDISRFIKLLKINLASLHNKKYVNNIQIDIDKRELLNEGDVITAVNYVLKNPIHHKIADIAFSYPYSSAHIYFKEQIYPAEYYEGERFLKSLRRASELERRVYQTLFASHKVPENYLILENKLILPDSFIKVNTIERLYSSARNFMFQMNKPLKEELEMFGAEESNKAGFGKFSENPKARSGKSSENQKGGYGKLNGSDVSLFGKLTDMQVCKIIDDSIYPKTYTQITLEERSFLEKLLRKQGVDKYQLERVF